MQSCTMTLSGVVAGGLCFILHEWHYIFIFCGFHGFIALIFIYLVFFRVIDGLLRRFIHIAPLRKSRQESTIGFTFNV